MPVGGVSDTAVVAPLALQAPPTAGPTANGPAGGMQVMPLVLWDSDGVTILPGVEQGNSGWQVVPAAQGGVQGAVDSPNPVEPWEPGGLLPEWEYRMYQEQGVLPPDARHTAEDPSVGSSDGDSEPWPLDPKTGHLRAFGPRVEGGDAKEAFGQVPGRVNGVLADVGGIVVAEGAPVLAGFWWFVTKGDDAVDIARVAKPGKVSDAVRDVGDDLKRWLGDFDIKRNDDAGFVALSRDGKRRFRMDFDGHGEKPHAHL